MMPNKKTPLALTMETVKTPIGDFLLVVDEGGALRAAEFADRRGRMLELLGRQMGAGGSTLSAGAVPKPAKAALAAYFAGDLAAIRLVAVNALGTAFQTRVWGALRKIKPGHPMIYSAMAGALGKPNAARAVGHANGANPISIIVPCHRLIGANGSLTGYSGGIERKRWLLDHEARYAGKRIARNGA
jgi:methylated-DNA-[protein]-cysteine S-methyltransferase